MKRTKVVVHPPGYGGNFLIANGIVHSDTAYRPHHHIDDYRYEKELNEFGAYFQRGMYILWTEEELLDYRESIEDPLYIHRTHDELKTNDGKLSDIESLGVLVTSAEQHYYRVWLADIKKGTVGEDRVVNRPEQDWIQKGPALERLKANTTHAFYLDDPDFDVLFDFFEISEKNYDKFIMWFEKYEEDNLKLIDRFGDHGKI